MLRKPGKIGWQGHESVSLVQLIANPEKYDGRPVMAVGFVVLDFEDNVLYLHEEDFRRRVNSNGIWVDCNDIIDEQAGALNMHYVLIAGTFDASDYGHMGLFSGSIRDIKRADVWSGGEERRIFPKE